MRVRRWLGDPIFPPEEVGRWRGDPDLWWRLETCTWRRTWRELQALGGAQGRWRRGTEFERSSELIFFSKTTDFPFLGKVKVI